VSAFERVLEGLREVLRATDEIKRLSDGLKALAIEVRDIDRRLVRIETMAEIAKTRAGSPGVKRLRKKTD
jgi:hypothetical protein